MLGPFLSYVGDAEKAEKVEKWRSEVSTLVLVANVAAAREWLSVMLKTYRHPYLRLRLNVVWDCRGTGSSGFSFHVCRVPNSHNTALGPWTNDPRDRDTRLSPQTHFLTRIHMPPRRSTRSTSRLSVEPENKPPPQRSASAPKRKRTSGDNTDNEEQENQVKPPSRTTRRSSSSKPPPPATTSRTSSRSKSALRQVQGSDDDDDDDDREPSHPAKKSRPSRELEDLREEDEEDVKPVVKPRTRRAAAISAASDVSVKAEPPDEPSLGHVGDNGGEEHIIPTTSKRRAPRASSRKANSSAPRPAEDEDFAPDTNLDKESKAVLPDSNGEPVLPAGSSTPVPSPKKLPTTSVVHEEERSLLDDLPVSPAKVRHAPPPVEEPKGPCARLVIHKLVLVNFKSYAGRQEIGPFHKVCCFRSVGSLLIPGSLSLQLSDRMVLESRTPSMHSSLSLDIVLLRCDKENFLSSYITPLNTLICKSAAWRFISVK